jgi:hypothetical protein
MSWDKEYICVMFRIVFWYVLPCKIIVDRRFRGGIPDDGGSTRL